MKGTAKTELLISIISHDQGDELITLLNCIEKHCSKNLAVVVTLNVEEKLPFSKADYSFPLIIIENFLKPRGFSTNHNQAFACMESDYFCVLNTDVYFSKDPFPCLIDAVAEEDIGVIAPLAYSTSDQLADSARKLPTPFKLLQRRFIKRNEYLPSESFRYVDWVAGFFMLFDSELFKKLCGFDEKYFLYCEDVDICSRIWLDGKKVAWAGGTIVYHEAKRRSHSQLYYLARHIISMLRLFCSKVYYRRLYQKHGQR